MASDTADLTAYLTNDPAFKDFQGWIVPDYLEGRNYFFPFEGKEYGRALERWGELSQRNGPENTRPPFSVLYIESVPHPATSPSRDGSFSVKCRWFAASKTP